jgi:hypothetical protein
VKIQRQSAGRRSGVNPERCGTHSQTIPCHSYDRAFQPGRVSRVSGPPRPASRQSRQSRRAPRAIHERCARACRGRQTARETENPYSISSCEGHEGSGSTIKEKRRLKTYVCQLQRTCVRSSPDQLTQRRRRVLESMTRTHRDSGAELHRRVNVLGGRLAALDHPDRLQQVRHKESVDDKAGIRIGVSTHTYVGQHSRFVFPREEKPILRVTVGRVLTLACRRSEPESFSSACSTRRRLQRLQEKSRS